MTDSVPGHDRRSLWLGAVRLDVGAYAAIAADRSMSRSAVAVVALSAIAHAVGGLMAAIQGGWAPIRSIGPSAVSQFVLWVVVSLVGFGVGRLLGGRATLAGMLRAVGVAWLAALLYLFAVFPPVLIIMWFYWPATTFVAIRGALGLDPGRAVIVLAVALVAGYVVGVSGTLLVLDLLASAGYPE